MIKLEQLIAINDGKRPDKCEYYLRAINKNLYAAELERKLIRLAHFLAQIIHESGNFAYSEENLNYSVEGLLTIFSKYFDNRALAEQYARKPEKIANRVYANRMGNGDEASGDGWNYRGRGLIQLTGKNNYKACGDALGLDLVNKPVLLSMDVENSVNAENSVKAACWYWRSRGINTFADKDDIAAVTKLVNGGMNGIADRIKILQRAKKEFNI
jgi:putative chitinase